MLKTSLPEKPGGKKSRVTVKDKPLFQKIQRKTKKNTFLPNDGESLEPTINTRPNRWNKKGKDCSEQTCMTSSHRNDLTDQDSDWNQT